MKLSGNGLGSISYHLSKNLSLGSYEFDPKDFKDGVALSTKEARLIFRIIKEAFVDGVTSSNDPQVHDVINQLYLRIEHADEVEE